MKKVLVCIEDALLNIRISRILSLQNVTCDLVSSPIRKEDLNQYELLIIHTSYKLTGLYAFVENVVIHHTTPIILISTMTHTSSLHQLKKHPTFSIVDEHKMDALLPLAIEMIFKQKQMVSDLEKENSSLKRKIQVDEAMHNCKRYLISTGLSEDESHQRIIKYAMDNKISKYNACIQILQLNNKKTID